MPRPHEKYIGKYILLFPVVLIASSLYTPTHRFYLDLSWDHIIYLLYGGYYNMYMFCLSECDTYRPVDEQVGSTGLGIMPHTM